MADQDLENQQEATTGVAPEVEQGTAATASPQARRSRNRRRPPIGKPHDDVSARREEPATARGALDIATETQLTAAASGELAVLPTPGAIATRRRHPRVPQIAGTVAQPDVVRDEPGSVTTEPVGMHETPGALGNTLPTHQDEIDAPEPVPAPLSEPVASAQAAKAMVDTYERDSANVPVAIDVSDSAPDATTGSTDALSTTATLPGTWHPEGRDDVDDGGPPMVSATASRTAVDSFTADVPTDVHAAAEGAMPAVAELRHPRQTEAADAGVRRPPVLVAPPREAQRRRSAGWMPSVRPATIGPATTPRTPVSPSDPLPRFTTRSQAAHELPSLVGEEIERTVSLTNGSQLPPASIETSAVTTAPDPTMAEEISVRQIDAISTGAVRDGVQEAAYEDEMQTRRRPDRRGGGSRGDRYGRQRDERMENVAAAPVSSVAPPPAAHLSAPVAPATATRHANSTPPVRQDEQLRRVTSPAPAMPEAPAIGFRPVVDLSPMRPPFEVDTDAAIFDVGGQTQLQHDDNGRGNNSGRRRGRERFTPRGQGVVHHEPTRVSPSQPPESRSVAPIPERIVSTPVSASAAHPPVEEPTGELGLLLRGMDHIQQRQTERILAALRQTPVFPPVSPPQAHLEERIGVFVDVANMLYAARYLNRWIDFGRLLDRLVAGRRLVRAQAYSPTDPDPNAEQSFLAPVRGQGYRVTTKHYRTFSSGAKKADMDLDICMDIVRIVDARAVDCIVLCSGDGDFMPVIQYCYDHGVRVEIAAFAESTHDELKVFCDKFINLSMMDTVPTNR